MADIIETAFPTLLILIQSAWWLFLIVMGVIILNCASNDKKNKPVEPSYKFNPAYKAEEDDLWII